MGQEDEQIGHGNSTEEGLFLETIYKLGGLVGRNGWIVFWNKQEAGTGSTNLPAA